MQILYFEDGGGDGSGGGGSGKENLVGVLLNWRHTHIYTHTYTHACIY